MRAVRPYVSKHIEYAGKLPLFVPANWRPGTIEADTMQGYQTVRAEIMYDFAVHKMIRAPGYCISYAPLGFRIESRERAFKSAAWAKHVAEKLHPISNDWGAYAEGWPFPEITVKLFNYIFDVAEYQGACLDEAIPAADRIRKMPTLEY